MSFCDDCETNWIFGRAGDCKPGRERVCDCPEGFNGVDVWFDEEDCHININTRRTLYIGLSVLFAIGFLSSFTAFYFAQRLYKGKNGFKSLFFFQDQTMQKGEKRQKSLNRAVIILLLLSTAICLGYFSEAVYFASTKEVLEQFDVRYIQNFLFGVDMTLLANYAHIGTFGLYLYLPNPARYGELIGLSKFLIIFPSFCHRFFYFNLFVSPIAFIIIGILEPINLFQGEPKSYFAATIILVFILASTSWIAGLLYIYNLNNLYTSLLESSTKETAKQINVTRRLLKWAMILGSITIVLNFGVVMLIVIYERYSYIFAAVSHASFVLFFCFVNGLILFYTRQGLTPLKIRTVPTQFKGTTSA